MFNQVHARLTFGDTKVDLEEATIDIEWNGYLAVGRVTQRYRNPHPHPVEVSYEFPLASKAVPLEIDVSLGERRLSARVVEHVVTETYSGDAIVEGDWAIRIKEVDPGCHELNLRSLPPGGEVRIAFGWAEFTAWQKDDAVLHVPSVLAPRLADPVLAAHTTRELARRDSLAEFPLEVSVRVFGSAARGRLSSPTHNVATRKAKDSVQVRIDGRAFLDRDFTLVCADAGFPRAALLSASDGAAHLSVALFRAQPPAGASRARDMRFVVDCPGTMSGDRIARARMALIAFVEHLGAGDTFNIIVSGSRCLALFKRARAANAITKGRALALARTLETEMGKTARADIDMTFPRVESTYELVDALVQSVGDARPGGTDIVLVTDGKASNVSDVAAWLARRRVRVFGVGFNVAPAEDVVRVLANATGGDHEFLTPNGDIHAAVARHLERLRSPHLKSIEVNWGAVECAWRWTESGAAARVCDPVIEAISSDVAPQSGAQLSCRVGRRMLTLATVAEPALPADWQTRNVLPRLVAGLRLRQLPAEKSFHLAMQYQIICRQAPAVLAFEASAGAKGNAISTIDALLRMPAAGSSAFATIGLEKMRPLDEMPLLPSAGWGDSTAFVLERIYPEGIPRFRRHDVIDLKQYGSLGSVLSRHFVARQLKARRTEVNPQSPLPLRTFAQRRADEAAEIACEEARKREYEQSLMPVGVERAFPRLIADIEALYGNPCRKEEFSGWGTLEALVQPLRADYRDFRAWHVTPAPGIDIEWETLLYFHQVLATFPDADSLLPRSIARLRRMLAGQPWPAREELAPFPEPDEFEHPMSRLRSMWAGRPMPAPEVLARGHDFLRLGINPDEGAAA